MEFHFIITHYTQIIYMELFDRNKKHISDKKKYILFSELYSLLSSGLSFSRSFELLINSDTKSDESMILNQIYLQILNGRELWRSIESSGSFANIDSGVIRIGEETGKLDQSLLFLSDYYRKKNEQRSILIGALSYPIVIVITAILVLFFMITVVIPMFEQVYSRMGSSLPEMTQFMVNLSAKFPTICLFCAALAIGLIMIRLLYGDTTQYKKIHSYLLLHTPFVGDLIKSHNQVQFCKLLYLLVSSDVPLLQSLEMLKSIIRFYPYSQSFEVISKGLKKGDTFSENLSKFQAIYGNKLIALVRVGEETNCLPKMFLNLANDISMELEHKLKRLNSILEPILIIGIGSVVAFVLVAMYLPMFKLGQTIS